MKSDLQINYGILDNIIEQLHSYKNALDKMEASLEKINAFISLNEGESVEAWEDQVQKIKRDIKNYRTQVKDLTNLFENYVQRTTAHIAPLSRNAMMRVDRNDIAANIKHIELSIWTNIKQIEAAIFASSLSFSVGLTDEEKEKSRSNKWKLDGIRSKVMATKARLDGKVDELHRIHETKVVRFEETDESFSHKAQSVKNKYTTFWECMGDAWEDTWDDISGFSVGLFKGLVGLGAGLYVLGKDGMVIYYSTRIPDAIEPDFLKKEYNATINKYENAVVSAFDDPMGVFEAIGQSFSDTYEKEGIAYLAGAAAPSLIPVAGVVGKLGKVAKVAGKVPASKTKGFSGKIKANVGNQVGSNKAFALGGLKIPVGIEKQVVSTGFNNITTYGFKTKTINDQFSQFAKVGDRVEGNRTEGQVVNKKIENIDDPIRTYRGADISKLEAKYTADSRLVVEMPYVGKGQKNTNAEGWLRDKDVYWKDMLKRHPEAFNKSNKQKIELGFSPVNNPTFRKYFP